MSTLTIIYSRNHSIGSILIRARDPFGQWSHCGIVDKDKVIEAVAFKGVIVTPLRDFTSTKYEIVQIVCPNPAKALEYAYSKVGSKYDYRSILGLATRNILEEKHRFNCVELVEYSAKEGGCDSWRVPISQLTPNLTYMVKR